MSPRAGHHSSVMDDQAPDLDSLEHVAHLMWPDLVEVGGCVFLATHYSEASRESFVAAGVTGSALEDVVNHVHLYDVVAEYSGSDEDLQRLEAVAMLMKQSWAARLAIAFPGRTFIVTFATEPEEYGPTVSFNQDPHG